MSEVAREKMLLHYDRRPLYHPVGLAQMLAALWFSSYFFFWLFDLIAVVALVKYGVMSSTAAVALVLAYLGQIAVYKPQNGKGWHFGWFLYLSLIHI